MAPPNDPKQHRKIFSSPPEPGGWERLWVLGTLIDDSILIKPCTLVVVSPFELTSLPWPPWGPWASATIFRGISKLCRRNHACFCVSDVDRPRKAILCKTESFILAMQTMPQQIRPFSACFANRKNLSYYYWFSVPPAVWESVIYRWRMHKVRLKVCLTEDPRVHHYLSSDSVQEQQSDDLFHLSRFLTCL